ncbi:hypothetical protein BGZ94_007520 [Podila epigama]|nr:hypothetical protein BGZ94_007520 [Podila epigama]
MSAPAGLSSLSMSRKTGGTTYKDSISHPINVSWIIPPWIQRFLNEDLSVPNNYVDLFAFMQQESDLLYSLPPEQAEALARKRFSHWRPRGNMGLSSCPGKKVRLDGPVNGRATIVRDLDLDFERLEKLGFTRVICCLFDEELEMLGSPFDKYLQAANSHGLDVVRIPMVEGSTPFSFEEMDRVLDKIDETIKAGENVLVHCRGGVGRAAVVACCWLLRIRHITSSRDVIRFLRNQRSAKAIETPEQEIFVMGFQNWVYGPREAAQGMETDIQRRIRKAESRLDSARRDAGVWNTLLTRRYLRQAAGGYHHQQQQPVSRIAPQQQPHHQQPHQQQQQQQQQHLPHTRTNGMDPPFISPPLASSAATPDTSYSN